MKTTGGIGQELAMGTLISAKYRILAKLGAGGMGEVYRAEDLSLNRQVAIKVLPDVFAGDPERLARFEREARVLASLNHPNIAAIHGVEEAEGKRFLVLELVEGDTLAERLGRGALSLEETLDVCRQIAEGLEAAHEKNIIHRDLKPSNVKITPEGKVKILDFGLARTFHDQISEADIVKSPTITADMTQPGVILGTAAYMSPEQAKGRAVDKRADIWAFGCILYECLAGTRAFHGDTITEIVASILKGEPDWHILPAACPSKLKDVMRRCLQKDAKDRCHDIADARIEISEVFTHPQTEGDVAVQKISPRRITMATVITFCVTAIGIAVLVWNLKTSPGKPVLRATIDLPAGLQLPRGDRGPAHTELALSPDGKILFFTASSDGTSAQSMLFRRPLDKAEATPIAGTNGARQPFISPDGQWVGFWAQSQLKKVASSGSSLPTMICDCPMIPQGASWSTDGRIVVGTLDFGLQLLSGEGEKLKSITSPDPRKEMAHVLPSFLPGGKAVLFVVKEHSWGTQSRIESLQLDSGERRPLIEDGADARLLPSGNLVFVRASTLMVARFDSERLKLAGPAVTIADGFLQSLNATVSDENSGSGQFIFSDSGELVYASGGIFPDPETHTSWVDQQGKAEPVASLDHKPIIAVRLSPDGRSIAFRSFFKKAELWVYDLTRGTSRILTHEGRAMHFSWTPDGEHITCAYSKSGVPNIFWMPADGNGGIAPVVESQQILQAGSWSPDGRYMLYIEGHPDQGNNIFIFKKEEKKSFPLFATDYDESYPEFSPEGRYLAFCTNETGRLEVYVTSFPETGKKVLVSTGGGAAPVWARDGRKLYYWNLDWNKLLVVDVTTSPSFSAGTPRFLFEFPMRMTSYLRNYDITLDGSRFLIVGREEIKPIEVTRLNLVQNWFEELKRLVPAGRK